MTNPFLEAKENPFLEKTENPFLEPPEEGSRLKSIGADLARPFLRSGQVFEEEAKAGIGQIKEAISEIDHPVKATIGSGPYAIKAGLGALRTAFSPLIGVARGMFAEPAGELAREAGAPPVVEQMVREGTEAAALIGGPAALSAATKARYALPFESEFTKLTKSFTVPESVKVRHAADKELAARASVAQSFEKADQFLKADLSKVQVPLPGKDRQVNYANYLITTEDMKRGIVAAEKIRGSTKATVSWKQTEKLAEDSGLTIMDLLRRGKREGHNATQLEAFKMMMQAASRNTMALRDKVLSGAATDADRALYYTQFNEMMDAMRQFQGAKSEAGRALNILRKPTGDTQIKVLQQLAEGKLKLTSGKELKELGVTELAQLTKAMETPAELMKFVESAAQATTAEKLVWAWKSGLLTGLRTHEVNFLSNTLVNLMHIPERALAAGIGKLHGKDKVYMREVGSLISGQVNGLKEGMALAGRTMRHGPQPESALKVTDLGRLNPIKGKTGTVIGMPFRLLSAEDDIFRTTARHMELNALAMRQAIKEGKQGADLTNRVMQLVENPTDDLIKAANEFAEYSVFTKELGPMGQAGMRFVRSNPVLQFIFPFIRTPVNIVKYAGERTPFALASKAVRAELKKGGAARDLALSKIIIGSGMSAWAATQVLEGKMTGRGPADPVVRQRWYDAGFKPYSIKVGNKWYPYSRFEPVGTLFGYAADAVEIHKAATEDEKAKIGTMIAYSFSQNIANKTFFVGASNAINAVTDPDRYGEKWIETMAGSFIPTIVGAEITQSKDPILREVDSIFDAVRARVPGQSEQLYPRRDIYGVPIKRHEGGLEAFMAVQPSTEKTDPAYTELVRLKLKIDRPERKIGGKEIPLEVYDRYQEMAGEMAKEKIDRFVSSRGYARMPRIYKEKMIKRFFESSRKIARLKLGLEKDRMEAKPEELRKGIEAR